MKAGIRLCVPGTVRWEVHAIRAQISAMSINSARNRQLCSVEIPRLKVGCVCTGLSPEQRYQVQKRFDLETLRGGG